MKTKTSELIIRVFIFCAAVFLSTTAFAQASYQSQIADLQSIEASLNDGIAMTQASITEYQDMVTSLDAVIADVLTNGGDATALQSQRQDALNNVSSLQA